MLLLHKQIGAFDYSLFELPNSELEPYDFINMMNTYNKMHNKTLFIQFEDQVVPIEVSAYENLAPFLSIYHNNTVRKNNEVSSDNSTK